MKMPEYRGRDSTVGISNNEDKTEQLIIHVCVKHSNSTFDVCLPPLDSTRFALATTAVATQRKI
jgi:hypothetical protein